MESDLVTRPCTMHPLVKSNGIEFDNSYPLGTHTSIPVGTIGCLLSVQSPFYSNGQERTRNHEVQFYYPNGRLMYRLYVNSSDITRL